MTPMKQPEKKSVEDRLVRSFQRMVEAADVRPHGLVVGVGDDAAVVSGRGEDLVITNDVLVEGRHFDRKWCNSAALGWRAAAVNLSDIAAMGATPRYAMVSLLIPDATKLAFAKGIERGVVAHFARYDAAVIGGNVSSTSGPLVVDITALGACRRARAWRRIARAGDAIIVAGRLGDAALGLELLRSDPGARGALVNALRKPVPRLDVSTMLASNASIHSSIDVSDGFSTDLIRMCEAGKVGCRIEASALPVSRALRARSAERGEDPLQWVMSGGEDYALILGVAPSKAGGIAAAIRDTLGVPAAVVGKFTRFPGQYKIEHDDGRALPFRPTGWDHFTARGSAR